METSNGTITNMFSINRDVFIFEIEGGLPVLNQYKVTGVGYKRGDILYSLQSIDNPEDTMTMIEERIFSSIREAIHVFNEGQDQFNLTIK